jgi:endo-1,4-beta-xylanase
LYCLNKNYYKNREVESVLSINSYEYLPAMNMKKNDNFFRNSRVIFQIIFILLGIFQITSNAQQLAQDQDKFLGASTSTPMWRNFESYWNQVTPGNDGKWGSVEQVKGTYNWTNLDQIYNYAKGRNLIFKEHVFIWGQQEPGWVASLDTASQRVAVEKWIDTLSQRYPLMQYIDVVNEPFHAPPSYKNALGGDGTTGWDWVINAFKLARKYCPSTAKLLLNEYNILQDYTVTTNFINLIKLLNDRGLIDGIGIQGHYFEFRSHVDATSGTYVYSPATLKSNLNRIAALGLPIYITEFDIDEASDDNQLAQYKNYFPVFWTNPAVKGITFWGYIEGDVWNTHPNTFLLHADGTERPAMQWLREYILKPIPPTLLLPTGVDIVQRNPQLQWQSSRSATSYHVQVSDIRAFSSTIIDTTITDTVIQLKTLAANTMFYWRVSALNINGESDFADFKAFTTGNNIVSVEEMKGIPKEFDLSQNFPNPFNPTTTIRFSIPALEMKYLSSNVSSLQHVTLNVFNVLGQNVATLVNEEKAPGNYEVEFNANGMPSGIYFYRLTAGEVVSTKKLILMK